MTGPLILPFDGIAPRIHKTAWIAPTATIIGDVEIGPHSSVFYGVVLRADINAIRIGERSNIQDNSVLHVNDDIPCIVGDDVTIGHLALVHGAEVGNGTLVGMNSTLLSGCVIGAGSLIAAGAVVLEGQIIPEKSLVAGVPGKVRRQLSPEQSQSFIPHAGRYVTTSQKQAPLGSALSLSQVHYE